MQTIWGMFSTKFRILSVVVGTVMLGGGIMLGKNLLSDGPARFTIETTEGQTVEVQVLEGEWGVEPRSEAGYRVEKVLLGNKVDVVGRGPLRNGSLRIEAGRVVMAEFRVEMAQLRTESDERDRAFRERIMDTSRWPAAVFTLSEPILLEQEATSDGLFTGEFTGTLQMRGRERSTTFQYQARYLSTGEIQVVARTTAGFDQWGIENPSQPGVIVKESAELEISLFLKKVKNP